MKYLQKLYEQLCSEQEKTKGIYNYTIPETWNLYGFAKHIPTRQKEIIIDPYAFTRFTIEHILNEKKRPLKTQVSGKRHLSSYSAAQHCLGSRPHFRY